MIPPFLSLYMELLLKYNVYCLCYCKTFIHSVTHSFMFWWKGDLFLFRYWTDICFCCGLVWWRHTTARLNSMWLSGHLIYWWWLISGWKLMDRQSALVALFWIRIIATALYTSSSFALFPILSPLFSCPLPHLTFFSRSLSISHIQKFSDMLKLVASISAKKHQRPPNRKQRVNPGRY